MDVSAGTTSAASTVTDSFSIIMLLLLWLVSPFGFVTTKKWVGKWWNRLLPRWLFVIWALLRHTPSRHPSAIEGHVNMWIQEGNCSMGFFPSRAWSEKMLCSHDCATTFRSATRECTGTMNYRTNIYLVATVLYLRLLGNKRSLNYTMWYIAPARRNYTTFASGSWPMLLDQEEVALRSKKKHQASSSCLLLLVLHNGSCSCISDCKQAFINYLIYYPTRITSYFIPKEI